MELVQVFEARLLDDHDEVLAIACGSSMNSAEEMAREMDQEHGYHARNIEVAAAPVPRFRAAVLDSQQRPMYFGYGSTPETARAQAAFWVARQPATVH